MNYSKDFVEGHGQGYKEGYDSGLIEGRADPFAPWYYATDGDIWALSCDGVGGQYIVSKQRFHRLPLSALWSLPRFAREFETGSLIWSNEYPRKNS